MLSSSVNNKTYDQIIFTINIANPTVLYEKSIYRRD